VVFQFVTLCSVAVRISFRRILLPPSLWRWGQHGPPKRWYPTTSIHDVTTWRWRQHGPPKRWYSTTTLHGVTTKKT